MRILLLILTLFVSASIQADVYRSVDENGNIVYTDKPSPDAEKIQVDEIQTIEGDEVEPFVYTPPARDTDQVSPYTGVQITSPQDNQTLSNNAGELNVTVAIQPGLIPGHQVVLYLDGNQVAEGGPQIKLDNVARGTHSLSAAIKTSKGKELERSAAVSFTLHRHSVQHTPPTVGKPPPKP